MSELYSNYPIYFSIAIVGTSLFLVKMILFLLAGDGDAGDLDAGSGSHMDGGEAFTLLSIQSILAFFMGFGWMGLACREEWGVDKTTSMMAAAGFGFAMMFFNSFLMMKIKGLDGSGKNDISNAVGVRGRAYTDIPKKGEGMGQVEITVNGKQQIINAFSEDKKIKSFASIVVMDVDDSGNAIVQEEI